jgi:hypothetical protein
VPFQLPPSLASGPAGEFHDLRKVLEPLFVKYGVTVVFAGHDHVYERVLPQQGIYCFTNEASGDLRHGDPAPSAITAKGFDTDRSFMMVDIAGVGRRHATVTVARLTTARGGTTWWTIGNG